MSSVLQHDTATLARTATNPECWPERLSFWSPHVQRMHKGGAMRSEQRQRHVVLYVAHANRMRCRLNRDSVHDTLHEQPPLHHSIDLVFSARQLRARKDLCRPAS
jgi:hypothetical protein